MKPNDPRMANVVCDLAKLWYADGQNGLKIAEHWIEACIFAFVSVCDGRAKDPRSFPGYGQATPSAAARAIIARLLDAGWRPPDVECLDVAVPLLDGGE